jgi:2-polyprenyl-6-hydroxyphenyl methylase/3-demethylubiquinone-9 3-methyltransferase
MWKAVDNAADLVAPNGTLFIGIYNDQGAMSRVWRRLKRTYNELPPKLRGPYTALVMTPREVASAGFLLVTGRPQAYIRSWTHYRSSRGMNRWHDLIDWIGGYPFEVAKPEQIFERCRTKGFVLEKLVTNSGNLGCNEYVFTRIV